MARLMTWARLEERFPSHRKVRRLSDAAFRLQVSAICWSCEYLTDGHISEADLGDVSQVRRPAQAASELVESGRWHLPGHDCQSEFCFPIPDGWLIHNFLEYQPSRSKVETQREKDAERKRAGRDSESRRNPHGVQTESAQSPPVPSRPVPTRPTQTPTESAAQTITQRSKRITDAYAEQVPLSNWPAVNGVVLKALKSERYADDEIGCALLRLAHDGRAVTVDVLRTELEGFGQRASPNRTTERLNQGVAVVRSLQSQARGELA